MKEKPVRTRLFGMKTERLDTKPLNLHPELGPVNPRRAVRAAATHGKAGCTGIA